MTVAETETETVTETETLEAAPEQEPATTETTEADAPGRVERQFGGTGIDGGIAFSVIGWREAAEVPQEFSDGPARAGAGAKFVLVDVAYTNKGKIGVNPFCGGAGATLIDDESRNFDHDSSVAISMPDNPICDELQPGFRERVTLVFKMPKSAKQNSVALWNSGDPDDYSGDSYVVFAP